MAAKRKQPEQEIQRAVVQHILTRGAAGLFWFAVPNGGYRSPIEAAIMKSTGTRSGVPDLCFLHDGKFFALELKAEKGNPTLEQLHCIGKINTAGGFAAIARGLDPALKILEKWGVLKGTVI